MSAAISVAPLERNRRPGGVPNPQQRHVNVSHPRHQHYGSHHHHARSRSTGGTTVKAARFVPISSDGAKSSVLIKIVPHLDFEDLLRLRLVCKEFNHIICGGTMKTGVGPLWIKGCLYFDARTPATHGISQRTRTENLISRFQKFNKNTLITEFNCPNYHFYYLDARFEIVRKFFQVNGSQMKFLRLNHCILSLVSFQRILQVCPNLETFQVNGMFHCLCNTESLFASKQESSLTGFINIRSLKFESTYVSRLIKHKSRSAKHAHVHFVDDLEIQDLHPAVVREMLFSASKLESLSFSGFGIATVNCVLHNLARHQVHAKLVEVGFYDIPNAGSPSCLAETLDLSHLKLKKFALTFLDCELKNIIFGHDVPSVGTLPELHNLDQLVRKVLLSHQCTLESLDLRNCNVTEAIFFPSEGLREVPALRKLCLQGTQIKGLSENSKFVLRKYLEEAAVGLRGSGSGPIPRSTVDEIIDAALFDIDSGNSGGGAGGSDDPNGSGTRHRHEEPKGFCNCCRFDTFCLAGAFAVAVVGLFYFLITWYGDSAGRIIFLVVIATFLLLYTIVSVISSSMANG